MKIGQVHVQCKQDILKVKYIACNTVYIYVHVHVHEMSKPKWNRTVTKPTYPKEQLSFICPWWQKSMDSVSSYEFRQYVHRLILNVTLCTFKFDLTQRQQWMLSAQTYSFIHVYISIHLWCIKLCISIVVHVHVTATLWTLKFDLTVKTWSYMYILYVQLNWSRTVHVSVWGY